MNITTVVFLIAMSRLQKKMQFKRIAFFSGSNCIVLGSGIDINCDIGVMIKAAIISAPP